MASYMQNHQRNLVDILKYAAQYHSASEIVSRKVEDGSIHRYTYKDAYHRTCKMASALKKLGLESGERAGTLAWNTYRHIEAWYAIAGQEAVCHTINPRLFSEQIEYIINHGGDKFLFVDLSFVSVLEGLTNKIPTVEGIIIMTEAENMPDTSKFNQKIYCYEELLETGYADFQWPSFPEETLSSLCYTSGTTGNPKGVGYTHKSNLLQAAAVSSPEAFNISASQTILMVVPMFHANSWGLAYAAPMNGSKLVLPGAALDGASIYELLNGEEITFSAAVPTVWNMLLPYMKENDYKLPHLNEVVIGGSAVPRSMIEVFDKDYSVTVIQAWGMTEMSPVGTICRITPAMKQLPYEEQVNRRTSQGRALFGVDMKIVDEDGNDLPNDGKKFGRLMVRGPWIVDSYFGESESALDENGWFDTGDIALIDPEGFMCITDRAKDLIKSGGEWISSVELENAAIAHPSVELAAVIAVPHPKWEERPLLIVTVADGKSLEADELIDFLSSKVAKWWLPERVEFVDQIPMTATGKISKLSLREQFPA